LQTRFAGEPRRIFRDAVQLDIGGVEETALRNFLKDWFATTDTAESVAALEQLDAFAEWRNLPDALASFVPRHRMRIVIRRLESRQA
jgi:hypothetical protein